MGFVTVRATACGELPTVEDRAARGLWACSGGVFAVFVVWWVFPVEVDCGTITLCGGGEPDLEPGPPSFGSRTLPESASSAVAPTPSSSGMSTAAARRAAIQTERPLRLSLADNGLFPLPTYFPDLALNTRNAAGGQHPFGADCRCFRGFL